MKLGSTIGNMKTNESVGAQNFAPLQFIFEMLFDKQKSKQKAVEQVNYHFFFVEVPIDIVGPEAMAWGQGTWWPQKSLTHFVKAAEGEVGVGTRFKIKIAKPMTPAVLVEITNFIPNNILEFTFKSGMFKGGHEVIKIEERANGTRVDYTLNYRIKGILNQILWPLLYHKQYAENSKLIMTVLKEHVLKIYHDQQEKKLENS